MQIIAITVTLLDIEPEVVRGLEVPADIPLNRLHETLQAAFGWHNAHLYQFCIGEPYQMDRPRWMIRDFVEEKEDRPADATTLIEALEQAGNEGLTYLYDFGDDWEHAIEASLPKPSDTAVIYPRLTNIIGTCPPEDVGGAPGYQMFLETMADPKDPEHKQLERPASNGIHCV